MQDCWKFLKFSIRILNGNILIIRNQFHGGIIARIHFPGQIMKLVPLLSAKQVMVFRHA